MKKGSLKLILCPLSSSGGSSFLEKGLSTSAAILELSMDYDLSHFLSFGGVILGYNLKMSPPDSDIYAEIPENIPDSGGKYASTSTLDN